MENKYCVYKHIRLDNNQVFYVGIGNNNRPYYKSRRSKYWKNITNKTEYTVEILYNNLTWEDACELEIFLIKLYGRSNNNTGILCNLTDGGEGTLGFKHSEETKLKLSKISSKRIGELNPFYGKTHSDENKRKFSENQKGEKGNNYNKKFSFETRQKMSENNKRGKHPQSRKVINIETNQIWECMKDCSEELNISYSKLKYWVKINTKLIRYVE